VRHTAVPYGRRDRASATIALESNSTQALLAAAHAGAGVAVLPRFVAREHDDLVAVSDDVATLDLMLITHPEVRRDPKVRATADFLRQLAAGPPGLCRQASGCSSVSCWRSDIKRPHPEHREYRRGCRSQRFGPLLETE
jgi:hypothetical protein